MTNINLNFSGVERAAQQAFKEACYLLGREYTKAISEAGAFDGFSGDIVDTGALRASQRIEFAGPGEAQFSWDTEYALFVHEGYTLRNGEEIGGRPWTKLGLERFNLKDTYEKILGAKLDNATGT